MGTGSAYYLASTATGTLAVQIRDAPPAWSSMTIAFSQVAVLPANAANASGWIALDLAVTQIEFQASGNTSVLLALARVAPGAFSQLRIVVSSVLGILSGGPPVTMAVPDGTVVATASFLVHGAGTTSVTLDLDLGQSVQQTGGQWTFRPVLGPISVG